MKKKIDQNITIYNQEVGTLPSGATIMAMQALK